ncbi:hypothetical protein SprV_0401534700 [Sparganum proliferum]
MNTTHNPDTPTNAKTTTVNASDEDLAYACPHCDHTFSSYIGLVGHLRIQHTETGEPMPAAPTYTRRIRLHGPHCFRTFSRRMGLFGHMRIHESGIERSLDTPSASCTSTMHSSTHIPPPSPPATISSTTQSILHIHHA